MHCTIPRRLAWWLAALFLTVVGAKLWLIQACATPILYFDQWVEADNFIRPWMEGHLTWHDWVASHNGHRILCTRGLDLLGIKLNGEWDPLLQMTINALFHAGVICGLAGILWAFTGGQNLVLLGLLFVPFLALPIAAENTLWAFQSQFYFLIFFGIVAMAGLGCCRPGSRWWWVGLLASIFGLFTMGSGLLAPLAVAGLMGLRSLQARRITRENLITGGVCLAVFIAGAGLSTHNGVKSTHVWGDILGDLAWMLAWPFENKPTLLLFVCLPLALTAVKYFRGGFKDPRAAEFLMTLGLWVFLQLMAIAYARTNQVNCARYVDLFCLLPMASLASLFILGGEWLQGFSPGRQTALAVGWVLILFWGLWYTSPRDWQNYDDAGNYPLWSAQALFMEQEDIRTVVATGDFTSIRGSSQFELMSNVLNHPQLNRILPLDCRPPLPLEPDAGTGAAFVMGGFSPDRPPREFSRAWGNYSSSGITPGRFVSQPIYARLPRLQLELCCATNAKNVRIELVEQATGRRFPVRPEIFGQWQAVNVSAPASPFRLEVSAENPGAWVAVGALRETGRWSYFARRLQAHSVFILLAGLSLFAGLIGYDLFRRTPGLHPSIRWLALALVLVVWVRVWPQRNYDATQFNCELMANCAKNASLDHHVEKARRFLREALWLRPDDPKLKAQLQALSQPVPESKAMSGR